MDKAAWQAFGAWVESLRKRAGLQVNQLAERAGVSVMWLQEMRRGGRTLYGEWRLPNPKDEALVRLAQALDVPAEDMLTRAGRSVAPASRAVESAEPDLMERAESRIRELEQRVAQHEKDLAELRRQLSGQPPGQAEVR